MIWGAVLCCLLVSFLFSGIEAGILSVNRVRLKHRVKMRDPAALKLNRLLAKPERLLVTVLVVTNLMNITALLLMTQELVRRFGSPGYWLSLVGFLPIYLFVLEVLPKSLFRRFPYRALAAFAEPLRVVDGILAPMHAVGWRVSRWIFGHRPPEQQKLFVAREEFKYLTIESERVGTLTKAEREMIHNVVDFRGITAKDVMVPMEQVHTISARASISELLEQSRKTGFDRWPVIADDGQITGLVDVFDIAVDSRRHGVVESFQRRILRVRQKDPAYTVLRKMRAARIGLAVVEGEDAKPVGIVTSEDLIKRLVSTAEQT
ncbi:CNNM domain-containing protein [Verrucomicrobiota bacterium sgz303538]